MRILYTPFEHLSSKKEKKLVPKRNLIPGGRTRPQRVKNYFRKSTKIFDNLLLFGRTRPDYVILNSFMQFAKST